MQPRKFFVNFCLFILIVLFINFSYHIYRSRGPPTHHNKDILFVKYFIKDDKFTNLINAIPFTCGNYVSLVIVVLCETRNIHQRNIIRNTWGQWLASKYSAEISSSINAINYHSNQTKLLFAMGSKTTALADIRSDLEYLQNETYYDDVMYFPGLLDSYMNLTLKTLTGLNTARKKCPKATYFLKTDTDVFLNVPRLLDLCQQHFPQSMVAPLIIGNEQFNAPVIRDKSAKWYVPSEVYPNNYFPNYVTGCGYLLNSKAIDKIIYTASKVQRLFYWEDVAITGMYSTNVTIIDNKLFRYEDYMRSIDSCYMKMIILAHRIYPEKMVSIWNEITSNSTKCSILSNLSSSLKKFEYMLKEMIYG